MKTLGKPSKKNMCNFTPIINRCEYWCINDKLKPQWVQDLIDRKLLEHHPTSITECYSFKQTEETTSPIYLYDGDGLCYCDNKIGIIYDLYKNFEEVKRCIPVIKYYCDICEKEIFFKDDIYSLKLIKDYEGKNYDICEDCYNKIKKMINRKARD